MKNEPDGNFVVVVIGICVVLVAGLTFFANEARLRQEVEIESIKAGLVQDASGKWVKP